MNHSGDGVLQAIETICSTGVTELVNAGSKGSSTTFPTLAQSSFSSYYKIMFERLVFHEKGIAPFKAGDSTEIQSQKLAEWTMSARVMFRLISLIKVFDARPNLTTAIKVRDCSNILLRDIPTMSMTHYPNLGPLDIPGSSNYLQNRLKFPFFDSLP